MSTKYRLSSWLSSTGGPLIIVEEAKAHLWTGIGGFPSSDYELACRSADYASNLRAHEANVLVLGDEPLQTAVATSKSTQLLVRWKWADSEADVRAAVENIDFSTIKPIESLNIEWPERKLVVFDAADIFRLNQCLKFEILPGQQRVTTFVYQPAERTALLVHAIERV